VSTVDGEAYASSLEHVLDEVRRVGVLLVRRAEQQARDAEAAPGDATAVPDRLDEQIAARVDASAGVPLRLVLLAELFGLSTFDVDVVVLALAPEVDTRFSELYAHLQDDRSTQPFVGTVLDVLCGDAGTRIAARTRLGPTAPLLRHGLAALEGPGPSLPARTVRLDPRVAAFVLDDDAPDERLQGLCRVDPPGAGIGELVLPDEVTRRLAALAAHPHDRLVLHLRGARGVGKRRAAAALCTAWGVALMTVDGGRLGGGTDEEFRNVLTGIDRESRLRGAVLYWDGVDALLSDDHEARLDLLMQAVAAHPGPVLLGGEARGAPLRVPEGVDLVVLDVPVPACPERLRLWTAAVAELVPPADAAPDLPGLAAMFRLTGAQIRGAVRTARGLAAAREPGSPRVTDDDLYAAARLHSHRTLAQLARQIVPRRGWDDLVLPTDRTEQLREIVNQVRYRAVVYETWAFEQKTSGGHGLTVLFSGPPGTGKTMAAEVLAHTLGVDLYVIDLSIVVSKFIGETEKNLSRIFDEAATSNAVLFFDEADALFGRRTQVRDAHDRYANLETSYLLQKLEEHEGVVVLATNLRKNMDEAFTRRLHATVDFPVPDLADRRRLWKQVWPDQTPRDPALDLELLARKVDLPGGNIRNIALAGAFLAAADGGVVTMEHLLHATRREYQKMGKVRTAGDF
jgi:ATPase family associated with various cellular activities (AAA)